MLSSLPSKKFSIIDIQEVENFKAEFLYNFFTTDERINDSGVIPNIKTSTESFDAKNVSVNERFIPRYIKLTWKPSLFQNNKPFIADNTFIKNYIKKIHNEETFTNNEYTSILFQDNQLDGKLSFYVQEALENIEKNVGNTTTQKSYLDAAKSLNEKTSNQINGNFLADILDNLKNSGVTFSDANKKITQDFLNEVKNSKTRIQINNKLIKTVLRSAEEDKTGFFADETAELINTATGIQTKAIADNNSTILKGNDYDIEILDYIGYKKIDSDNFDPTAQIIGYIIDKKEILPNGTVVQKENIIIENPSTSTTIDRKIKYGSVYEYRIKSVAYMEFQAEENDSNSIIAVSFLVSSKESYKITINCIEEVPPPWPADFNVDWDYREKAARIMWSFPPNPQRDIKKFQVFRRKSIYEPFELIKMYDFDDSLIRSPYYEVPEHHLIEMLNSPKTYYLDKEFNKDSVYIYTLCSVDAHGYSSNYSMQYECLFDKFKNKMIKRLISTANAPKAYPNFFLNQDVFVDTIKNSGNKQMKIIFNPEYLDVIDKNGSSFGLLKTTAQNAKYRINLLNVDFQAGENIDINLIDLRGTENK